MFNLNEKLRTYFDEKEKLFEEYLIKIHENSRKNLNEIIDEIKYLERKEIYSNYSYYHIQNLKRNLNEIEEKNCHQLNFLYKNVKDEINEILNQLNQLIPMNKNSFLSDKLTEFFCIICQYIYLKEIFYSIGLNDRIDSIISLFTGMGVLGINPIEKPLIINNIASEIMFKDKLKDIYQKLDFILQFIQQNQFQQIQILKQIFQDFQTNLSI